MYDPIEVAQAAAKARGELERSGQVGSYGNESITILNNQTIVLSDDGDYFYEEPFIVEGAKYKVIWDGVEYSCVGHRFATPNSSYPNAYENYIGNGSYCVPPLGENTGEPFLFYEQHLNQIDHNVALTESVEASTHTVSISQETETIHPIDPKYLPGVCLPMVEISTALNLESPVTLTKAESTELDGAMALETPVIAKCINVIDGVGMAVVCTNFGGALLTGFYGGGQLSGIYVSFSKDEDNGLWVVTTTLA